METGYKVAAAILIGAAAWAVNKKRKEVKGSPPPGAVPEFTRDLSAEAEKGIIDPVIGRDDEIDRVIHIIARRMKNNPLLIGEAGVGKTAVVEGLAQRIAQGRVPDLLKGKRVLAVDLAKLLAGTGFRGELEQRLRLLLEQLEQDKGKTVLFIDELHMIDQAKGSDGGLNLSDMIKPALARGDISVIGASTWQEYQRTLRLDAAIDRRFQPVLVGEPSEASAIEIMRGLKEGYEQHHGVSIDEDALIAAVRTSAKIIKDRFLPDKALDVLDEASAKVSIEASLGHRASMGVVHEASKKALLRHVREEQEAIGEEAEHLRDLHKAYPSDAAIAAAAGELENHARQLNVSEHSLEQTGDRPRVTVADIEEVIREWREYYASGSNDDKPAKAK